ncbi:hypothetical protein H6F86_14850 [Phormidium sp. FACHB-592]|uniref:Uncharacterized protein n=1 Tax=Stenomitos frigidus AS-A4 TaxID=2933935 RepID=A0ABV0KU80_9CYAN|nr:hypothetical protein [Phormidium sp. FACHB-592]MBD2075150.1 hypothetical protein [Phormidium sp. FACHB-592]
MKTWNAFLLATAVTALGFAIKTDPAQAFCVYNKTDKPIYSAVPTLENLRNFSVGIPVNNSSCCNWKNKDCNPTKKQNGILDAEVRIEFPRDAHYCGNPRKDMLGRSEPNYPRVKMQGGGYLTVVNNPAYKGAPPKTYWDVKIGDSGYLVQSWTYDHKLLDTYPCTRIR